MTIVISQPKHDGQLLTKPFPPVPHPKSQFPNMNQPLVPEPPSVTWNCVKIPLLEQKMVVEGLWLPRGSAEALHPDQLAYIMSCK